MCTAVIMGKTVSNGARCRRAVAGRQTIAPQVGGRQHSTQQPPCSRSLGFCDVSVGEPKRNGRRKRYPRGFPVNVSKEALREHATGETAARGTDHPRQCHVERGITATSVRPIDHDGTTTRQEDVARMEVQVTRRSPSNGIL